jgi:hypothetical protein
MLRLDGIASFNLKETETPWKKISKKKMARGVTLKKPPTTRSSGRPLRTAVLVAALAVACLAALRGGMTCLTPSYPLEASSRTLGSAFAGDYAATRDAFVAAARQMGAELHSIPVAREAVHGGRAPDGSALTIDVAVIRGTPAERLAGPKSG